MHHANDNKHEANTIRAKWGSSVTSGDTGFLVVPDVLIKYQVGLNISPTDMAVLLNIVMHWWKPDELPHPRPSSIASRIGVSTRTVERCIKKMEKNKLIIRRESEKKDPGNPKSSLMVRRYDLSGLIARLEEYARVTQMRNMHS